MLNLKKSVERLCKQQIQKYHLLNADGKEKVDMYINDLLDLPKYQADAKKTKAVMTEIKKFPVPNTERSNRERGAKMVQYDNCKILTSMARTLQKQDCIEESAPFMVICRESKNTKGIQTVTSGDAADTYILSLAALTESVYMLKEDGMSSHDIKQLLLRLCDMALETNYILN